MSELLSGHAGCRAWNAEGGCGSRSRPFPRPCNRASPLEEGGGGVRREARGQGVDLLRVQHLPGSGARPRGDAMWSSVLLAVHLQVRHATVASLSPSPAAILSPTPRSDPDSSRISLSPARRWLQVFRDAQQCPVCKAVLPEDLVIPLYGRGTCGENPDKAHGRDVPLRPPGIRFSSRCT